MKTIDLTIPLGIGTPAWPGITRHHRGSENTNSASAAIVAHHRMGLCAFAGMIATRIAAASGKNTSRDNQGS